MLFEGMRVCAVTCRSKEVTLTSQVPVVVPG